MKEQQKQILLAILALGGEDYSLPIAEKYEEFTGKRIATGVLFLHFSDLEINGYLEKSRLDAGGPERGFRAKAFYRLTEKAKDFLQSLDNSIPQADWENQFNEILKGMDKEDGDAENQGWWETSTGAEFGAKKKTELKQFIRLLLEEKTR